jgi:multisubunit Na+/H+ antiporter MnhC subunit
LNYKILDISEIKSEEAVMVGVLPRELYKYALISNGITIPQGQPLTPEMIGASEAKKTNAALGFGRQHAEQKRPLVAVIILTSLVVFFLFFKLFLKGDR